LKFRLLQAQSGWILSALIVFVIDAIAQELSADFDDISGDADRSPFAMMVARLYQHLVFSSRIPVVAHFFRRARCGWRFRLGRAVINRPD
jgi:hypothetical protein